MKLRKSIIWMFLPVLLLVAGSVLAGPKNGVSKKVTECGTILTEPGNYKLVKDLLDCPGNGVEIVGSDITLNLKGYEISCPEGWYGVFVNSSSKITVKNGRVSNCDVGIAFWLAEDSRVMKISSTGNRTSGIAVWASHNIVLMHNHTQGNAIHGIESWESGGNLFKHNTSLDNGGDWFGSGIDLVSETNSRIMCNRVHGNTDGVLVGPGSNSNLLRGNFVSDNIYTGIGMMGLHWKNPDPPYDEHYYAMPSENTVRSNVVENHPGFSDLLEFYYDDDTGDVLLHPENTCINAWERNQFQTEFGPPGCFGIPVALDENDVCAFDHDD